MKKIAALGLLALVFSCQNVEVKKEITTDTNPESGMWRATITLNDSTLLPFNFELQKKDSSYSLIIHNAEERITVNEIEDLGDSLRVQMPVFVNYLVLQKGAKTMNGWYINPDGENYKLPFKASYGNEDRFEGSAKNCCDIAEKWAVKFRPGAENEKMAIAYFKQQNQQVTGTFVTETGDYRYLQGNLFGNHLQLSSFDGTHLYYFTAQVNNGQITDGLHYSGRGGLRSWLAYRDDDFELRNADSLTFLKEGYDTFDFSFNDVEGNLVSLSDDRFKDKALIVQIMGSWCPNCMDETRYLKDVYAEYQNQGLEVVGLNFERGRDVESARKRTHKMINDLEIPYPILLAGITRDDKAAELLPMLNHVMSYPTSIYLNRDKSIRKIHTGFAGPGTPLFDTFVRENEATIQEMLQN